MRVRFWGTRGSVPSPGPETLRYGGNTSCVGVRTDDGTSLVLDCGTGARKLGLALAQDGPTNVHLLVGHTHADHIQGLPFFMPAFVPGSELTVYGSPSINRDFPSALGGQMDYTYFPVPLQDLPASLRFVELGEEQFSIGDVCIRTQHLNHTAPCIGFRVEVGGACLVYASDHEQHVPSIWRPDRAPDQYDAKALLHPGDRRHVEFLRGADLLIHDAQYLAAEYPQKKGWGHSTVEYVIDVALAAGVKQLALYHHDPTRTDEEIDVIVARARDYVSETGLALEVMAAREGAEVELLESTVATGTQRTPDGATVLDHPRILVADDDPVVTRMLDFVLSQDGCDVVVVGNGADAVETAKNGQFQLILIDMQMPRLDGLQAVRAMRADPRLRDVPIVMLTALSDKEDMIAGFNEGVTDYMTKPFAMPQVRARVRSWLSRSPDVQR